MEDIMRKIGCSKDALRLSGGYQLWSSRVVAISSGAVEQSVADCRQEHRLGSGSELCKATTALISSCSQRPTAQRAFFSGRH